MLGWRLLISAILIPALIAVFVLDHRFFRESGLLLLALSLLLALRAAWEMTDLLRTRSFAPSYPLAALCAAGVVAAAWFDRFADPPAETAGTSLAFAPLGAVAVAYAVAVILLFLQAAVRYREPGGNMETLGAELLAVSYVGVLLAVTARLRWVAGAEAGYLVLGSLVVAAKCGDIGAYTLGRLFGKRKMAPRLSPGKTWMGGLGAVLGAGLGGWAWLHWATPYFGSGWTPPAWHWAVLYGVVIGIAGLIGDLCESLIKRDVGRKDAAALFPGFGGLLDLLDSVLYAGPVAYVLWHVLPLATWR